MTPPSSTEYKPPNLLGDEQARLIRMEEIVKGAKDVMSELRDEMKSINHQLSLLEQNRAKAEMQTEANAKDILKLQTELTVACEKLSEVRSDIKGYKFTLNVMKVFIGTLLAGLAWLILTVITTQGTANSNTTAIQNLKDSINKNEAKITNLENRINDFERNKEGQ